jgi:hypothetical protein
MDQAGDVEPGEPRESAWTDETEQLLRDWRNRAYASQIGYYMMADRFRRWNYWLGIPVVIGSSIVGTTIFASLKDDVGVPARVAFGSISLLAAVLASLQTFLRFAESATIHGASAAWYSAIRREIESTLALPRELRGDPKACFDSVRKEMNKVAQKSPELNARLWASLAKRFGVNEPAPTS